MKEQTDKRFIGEWRRENQTLVGPYGLHYPFKFADDARLFLHGVQRLNDLQQQVTEIEALIDELRDAIVRTAKAEAVSLDVAPEQWTEYVDEETYELLQRAGLQPDSTDDDGDPDAPFAYHRYEADPGGVRCDICACEEGHSIHWAEP